MLNQLRQFLTAPVFDDENKTRQASILQVILLGLMVVPIPYFMFVVIQTPWNIGPAGAESVFGEVVIFFLFFILHRGHVRLASVLHLITFWGLLTFTAVNSSGVRGTAYLLGNGLVIIIAGLLFGELGTLLMTTLVALSGGVIVFTEARGWYTPPVMDTPVNMWIISICLFPVGAGLQNLSSRITQQALKRAHLSETRLRGIIDNIPDVILETDLEGKITLINRYQDIYLGKNVREFTQPDNITEVNKIIEQAFTQGDRISMELQTLSPDGSVTWNSFRVGPIGQGGTVSSLAVIITDISERKQAEAERENLIAELEKRNAELERFNYTLSHELKTPLVTIKGFLGFVEEAVSQGNLERARADFARIAYAADKMHKLIQELLELSRIGGSINPPEDIPFSEIVEEGIKTMEGQISAGEVTIVVADDLPVVHGDRRRLEEVIQILIDNAIKYKVQQTALTIHIGTRSEDHNITFFVQDNGIGIDPVYHNKVFGLFEKLDAQGEGSGVGLTIAKRIIETHGGRIWIESKGAGRGTKVCFTLPTV